VSVLGIGVTVHAAQEEVDAEVGHEDGEESQDHEEMEVAGATNDII
jgi:hypothetical protein